MFFFDTTMPLTCEWTNHRAGSHLKTLFVGENGNVFLDIVITHACDIWGWVNLAGSQLKILLWNAIGSLVTKSTKFNVCRRRFAQDLTLSYICSGARSHHVCSCCPCCPSHVSTKTAWSIKPAIRLAVVGPFQYVPIMRVLACGLLAAKKWYLAVFVCRRNTDVMMYPSKGMLGCWGQCQWVRRVLYLAAVNAQLTVLKMC